MKTLVLTAWVLAAAAPQIGVAAEPSTATPNSCATLNNRILGPRNDNRPIPLMRETGTHSFTPACSVPWTVISPRDEALPVQACFHGSLLQLANDSACGAKTGRLWVGTRWVVTSADLAQEKQHAAICQKLETGAWAGTRALTTECQPRTRELSGFKVDEKAAKSGAPDTRAPKPDGQP